MNTNKGKNRIVVEVDHRKRDDRMNSVDLLKILGKSSHGNFFEIEIPIATKEDERIFKH